MSAPMPIVAPTSEGAASAGRRTVARAIGTGLWIWPAFGLLDVYMCLVAYPGAPLGTMMAYRVVVELVFYLVYRESKRTTVPLERLFWLQNVTYGLAALFVSLMAVDLGGIRSPYMHGVSIVALVRAALVPTHWRRGVATYARIALSFPLVMGAGAVLSPLARAEWLTSESLIVFTSNYVFVLTSCFIGLVTGHLVWQAQEQLYRARRVGRYRLQAPIGKGGMGEVWLAWDLTLRRNVALKILRAASAPAPEAVRRFELEAQAAAQLRGSHVARIFDFGASEDGLQYIAMEYLAGMNLGTLVEKRGPLPPDRALDAIVQACLALEEAHAAGIIHRDIKPQNLFLTRTDHEPGFVKLLDFGIARLRSAGPDDERLTWEGTVVGTPAYLAPELWVGAEADERSDVYALGITLHFLLTGATPFEGWSLSQLHAAQLALQPPALRLAPLGAAGAAIEPVLRRAIAPARAARTQSARELRDALSALCDPEPWTAADGEAFWQTVESDRVGWSADA